MDAGDQRRSAAVALLSLLQFVSPAAVGSAVNASGHAELEETRRFAHGLGALLVKRDPEHLTQELIKADRGARILIDTGRNGFGAPFAAVYAVRPKPGAPVSAPCTWEEVESGAVGPQSFTLRNLSQRLSPCCGKTAVAFGTSNALGTRDEIVFVAAFPAAHTLACLRIAGRVTATGARLATGWAYPSPGGACTAGR